MNSFKDYLKEACDCWKGHKRVPGTKPCAPGSCVKEQLGEGERGLWDNIHAKRKRIKAGSGEKMRKPGSKGAPTDAAFKAANEEVVAEVSDATLTSYLTKLDKDNLKHRMDPTKRSDAKRMKSGPNFVKAFTKLDNRKSESSIKEELSADEQFDVIEETVEELAKEHSLDSEAIWEALESVDDTELLEYAIDKKGHKSSEGGLTQKGVDAYNAKTGGNLKMAVTTPPSKLKAGSKAANRRKSFCARMGGMEGSMKKPNGEPTRKALALRKWNC
jgi:hypothetical protein